VWVRSLDTLESRVLPGTENAGLVLFWSPDSRSLAFGVTTEKSIALKRVEVSGGPPQTLCETGNSVPTGTWSREGVIVLSHGGMFRVPAAGGDCSPLTKPDSARGEIVHRLPSFLPDGRHFVYLRVSSRPENQGIYVGSLDARPEEQSSKRLLASESGAVYAPSPDSKVGYLLFIREGTLMAQPFDAGRLEVEGDAVPVAEQVGAFNSAVGAFFSVSPTGALAYRTGVAAVGGNLRLTWFDRQGKVLSTEGDLGQHNSPALSPDGTQVAFTRRENGGAGNPDVWLLDVARGTSTRFTFHPAADVAPVWSPDGSHIVFASERDGPLNLYQKVSSGAGNEETLFQSADPKTPTDWSPNGRFLLFTNTDPKTGPDIWVLPMMGARKPEPYLKTEFSESDARFSPDGRFVAYQSNGNNILDRLSK
jgi:WD40 repeat protein